VKPKNMNKTLRYNSRSKTASISDGQQSISEADIWALVVSPVVEGIQAKLAGNALLPAFVVENPFHYFDEQIAVALNSALPNFRIDYIGGDKKVNEFAGAILKTVEDRRNFRLLILCTSRASIPGEFRGMIREDGYLAIPKVSFERLQAFTREKLATELPETDRSTLDGLEPQALVAASTLSSADWRNGLVQIASQKRAASTQGHTARLSDLHGIETVRNWAQQLISDIELAKRGEIEWREVDRGALMAGPPGTGKTTIARAIAHECNIAFISISPVKDWKSGDGLSDAVGNMSATFASARQRRPSILFIDEIDTLGNREHFTGQNASWDIAFLNNLLTEIDGFQQDDQLFIIGATNYADRVDPALKRAGRLDRVIQVGLPNALALDKIYAYHLEMYPHALTDTDIDRCAHASIGLTGADIEVIVRDARRRARREDNRAIRFHDVLDAIYRIPPEAERQPLSSKALTGTACHEAGHAVLACLFPSTREKVLFASVIPTEDALGFVALSPSENNGTYQDLLDRICILLGGRAAEEVFLGVDHVSTGAGGRSATSDLARARAVAENALGMYAFSSNAPNLWRDEVPEQELLELIERQYDRAKELLEENRAKHHRLSSKLQECGRLSKEQINED